MAKYKSYNKNGELVELHNLQDKAVWCIEGSKTEEVFVKKFGADLQIAINPQKANDPFAPDLIELPNNQLADLKVQCTPFFKSESLFGIPPRYAIVFNDKDRKRYNRLYPEIQIFYWIDWLAVRFEMGSTNIIIEPLDGVWKIKMPLLEELLKKAPLHEYQQRVGDKLGNAKSSYVLDIRHDYFIKCK
ncbi:MAG: hypothetical protein WCI48_16020 [Bacteroidota bacterium]